MSWFRTSIATPSFAAHLMFCMIVTSVSELNGAEERKRVAFKRVTSIYGMPLYATSPTNGCIDHMNWWASNTFV